MLMRNLREKAEYKIVYINDSNLKSMTYLHIQINNILGKCAKRWLSQTWEIASDLFSLDSSKSSHCSTKSMMYVYQKKS